MEDQYTADECRTIEGDRRCLICDKRKRTNKWVENESNGCFTFCCPECFADRDSDETGYWGMRGCCKCGERKLTRLIMGSCVCEKYFNLCVECAAEDNNGLWYCGGERCIVPVNAQGEETGSETSSETEIESD